MSPFGGVFVNRGAKPAAAPWPNEPAGFALVSDYGFPDPIPVGDNAEFDTAVWRNIYDASRVNGNLLSSDDGSAPLSPLKVLDFVYLQGDTTQAGSAPATVYYEPLGTPTKLYVGLKWRTSATFSAPPSSGLVKIFFVFFTQASQQMFWYWDNGNSPTGHHTLIARIETPGEPGNRYPNDIDVDVSYGTWHTLETYVEYGTTPGSNSILKTWFDNQHVHTYTDCSFPADAGFRNVELSPTWGGALPGESPAFTCHQFVDHVRISKG